MIALQYRTLKTRISPLVERLHPTPAGAGAGSLPSALHHHLPEAVICAVDLDPEIMSLGRLFFGLVEDERLQLQCADGLRFMEDTAREGAAYDVIIVDVADTSPISGCAVEGGGLTAPPAVFLSSTALRCAFQCLRCNSAAT